MKKSCYLFLFFSLWAQINTVQAMDILCSPRPKNAAELVYEAEGGNFTVAGEAVAGGMSLNDLFSIFSNGLGRKSHQTVLLCLFPQTHPNTLALFELLGINNNVIDSFFNERNIVIRRTKLVRSDQEMLACVASTYPSIGYIDTTPRGAEKLKCF